TGRGTATVTASRSLTISGISTTAPFGVTPPTLPVTLQTGQSLSVPVSFAPTGPGAVSAVLSFVTTVATVGLDLHATGTRPGFAATPASLDFGTRPVGSTLTLTVNIANTDTVAETVSAATPPAAPLTVGGLSAAGTAILPGA